MAPVIAEPPTEKLIASIPSAFVGARLLLPFCSKMWAQKWKTMRLFVQMPNSTSRSRQDSLKVGYRQLFERNYAVDSLQRQTGNTDQ